MHEAIGLVGGAGKVGHGLELLQGADSFAVTLISHNPQTLQELCCPLRIQDAWTSSQPDRRPQAVWCIDPRPHPRYRGFLIDFV